MTGAPRPPLSVTADVHGDRLTLVLRGDLDRDSAGDFLASATRGLADRPGLRELHLDCTRVGAFDATALSALLMLRRRTAAEGVRLHLDAPPEAVRRLLETTGTLEHLTADPAGPCGDGSAGHP
ncbi:STAS domain-containing protein [Kitasatospora sp. NPDC059571]|uniref:STAS domain-containing protein n=1 Tax=Kitasatospora sp. NPDC059571 TaxID=3346871 RepID=UPI0036C55C03